jgi:hypothetical protein
MPADQVRRGPKIYPLGWTVYIILDHGLNRGRSDRTHWGVHVSLSFEEEGGLIQWRAEGKKHSRALRNVQGLLGETIFEKQAVQYVIADHGTQ